MTAPKLTSIRNHIYQNVGTKFRLTCSIQKGSIPVHFEWHKNGLPLSLDITNRTKRIEFGDDYSNLVIAQVMQSDTGNYSCQVSNSFGHDVQMVLLTVKGLFFYIFLINFHIALSGLCFMFIIRTLNN